MIGLRLWQLAGWTMLHYLWLGAAMGAAALLLRQRLRSAPANVRYLAALGSLLLLSVAPAAIALTVGSQLAPAAPSVSQVADSTGGAEAMPPEAIRLTMPPVGTSFSTAAAAREPESSERLPATLDLLAAWLPWLWVFGTPLSFALTTAGLLGAERLRRQSRPLEDARISELCRRLAVSLRISRRIGVAVCDRIVAPILVGVFRPMILLPAAALAGWDPQQLEMVLLHELAHVRRYDNLVNLLQRVVESLLFFQPIVWIISGWVRREREHCCDELVVARTQRPQAYAEILVALAETFSPRWLRSSALAHPGPISSMAERPVLARIRRILKKEEQAMQVSRKAVGLVLVGLSVVALAIGGYYALPGRAEESPAAPVKAKTAPATAAVPAALLKPVAGKNFVIVPFTSELQQNRCKSYRTATFFVLINGAAMINADDTVLDVGAVDFKGLHDALLTFVQAHFPRRIIIYANVGTRHLTCGRGTASWFLLCQLHNLAPTGIPQTGLVWGEIDWKSVAADLATPATAEANQRESGIGDDLVRAYPICTPLSRYFFTTHADCVILNLKPLDQLTPKELEAFPARAKVYAEKLKLKQPIRANFNVNHGTSTVKANRARRKLRFGGAPGDRKWWRAQGFDLKGEGLWDSTSWTCPALYLKVTDEEGSPVKDVRITVDLPPEIKEAPGSLKFTQQSDGRWRSGHLPRDDEFTLIVDAPGYQPNRQKFTLPAGAKKDVEVKLKPAASKTTEPAAKTSAATPPQEKKAIRALTYTGRVTDKLTGKPIAGAAVTVRREILAPYELRLLEEPKYTTDASGRYTFTIPPEQVAERFLYIELDVSHPDYATRRGFGYALSMIRKNEPLGMRPFFEHVELYPADPIAGTVVTADGKPAAAVKVLGFSMPNRGDFESASFSDATTDPKGAFRLNLTKGSKAIFWILPKDDAPSAHLVDEKRGDLGRFTLEKGTALKGRVRDEHGKPVAGVWVNAEITGGPAKKMSGLPVADFLARAALTDAQGKFTLAPLPAGECVVRVADYPHDGLLRNQGHRPSPGVFGPQRLTLKADEATVLVGLRAVPQVVIEGQFYDSRGKTRLGHAPMLWGHLDLESSEGQSWMDLLFKPSGDAKQKNRNDPRSFYSAYGAMDKKGHFVIRAPKGLKDAKLNLMTNEHGALRVRMTKDGPLSNQHRDIDLGTLQHDVQGIEFVRYDAPILLVKPVAEKGGPLRDVKVNLEYAEGKGPWKGGGRFTEGKDVHFEKQNDGRWRSEQLLPDEEFTVTVDAAGYEPKSEKLKLPEGAVKDVEVRLKKKT